MILNTKSINDILKNVDCVIQLVHFYVNVKYTI
jgi:hypothetical protein